MNIRIVILLFLIAMGNLNASEPPDQEENAGEPEEAVSQEPEDFDIESLNLEDPVLDLNQSEAWTQEYEKKDRGILDRLPFLLHGFIEARGGIRLQNDPAQDEDVLLAEIRTQLEAEKAFET